MSWKSKVGDAEQCVRRIPDGASVMVGGFGLCGTPENLIRSLVEHGAKDLTVISNNAGVEDFGVGMLVSHGQVSKVIATFIGGNPGLEKAILDGDVEGELIPQGTFAERIRAAGAGIAGFYTPTGVGTVVEDGKEKRVFGGREYILEKPLAADFALVKGWKGDELGNVVYRRTARNFHPLMATAAGTTFAEVEELVAPGRLDPEAIATPGIFVDTIFQGQSYEKPIERTANR